MKILTELLDVVGLAARILFELVLQRWSVGLEELTHGVDTVIVLLRALEGFQGGEILCARALELGNGKLWQLVLVGEGDARPRVWVRVMTQRVPCFRGEGGLAVPSGDFGPD
jgi:hypothetical protein